MTISNKNIPLKNSTPKYKLQPQYDNLDTVQDVFYQLWKNKEKLNEIHNLKTYLFSAVKNNSLKKIRKLKIIRKESIHLIELNFDSASTEDLIEEKELRKAIESIIHSLPNKCKLIFCMHRFEDLTYKEIAEIQSISIKTVETQISRAIKFIRKRILPLLTLLFP